MDVSGLSLGGDAVDEPEPYDINSEQMPPHPFFSTEFQAKLREGGIIAERAVAVIGRMTDVVGHDETLDRLMEDSQRLTSFRATETKTVAILGDSGEGKSSHRNALWVTRADLLPGKSSLINSLLGVPGLAKTVRY
ncbi:hypothetical protein IMZ48_27700 [Candidatus Bathyarchaeota archaeon]|nr:hypothetical protein [Candidatus Bathyarchaeota archaeon]